MRKRRRAFFWIGMIFILSFLSFYQEGWAEAVSEAQTERTGGVSSYSWQMRPGETRKLTGSPTGSLPYMAVYGLDHPHIGEISPSGFFTAKREGKGTITVSRGQSRYHIEVDVRGAAVDPAPREKERNKRELEATGRYTIVPSAPDPAFQQTEYRQYPGPIDGLFSKADTWTGFFRQQARSIQIDLGKTLPVTEIALEFHQNQRQAVFLPEWLQASVSLDGKSWYSLGRVDHAISPARGGAFNRTFTLSCPPVTARYVTLHFPVDAWVFARHLTIKTVPAFRSTSPPAKLPLWTEEQENPFTHLKIPGIEHILLVYTGLHGEKGTWRKEDFIPLISYVKNGKSQGRMFDTLLFLPFPQMGSSKEAWSRYLADLFREDVQLDALDQAVGQLQAAGLLRRKVQVILTLPYPDPKQTDFGRLSWWRPSLSFSADHSGVMSALQNRYQAVEWFYKKMMEKWHQAGFANLQLAGMYWFQETVDPGVSGEEAFIRNIVRMVHQQGHKLFWIPYYGAKGYDKWQDYGFDYVLLQPNYYARDYPPEERMTRAVTLARKYRLGMELELDQKVLSNRFYYDLFYNQLNLAAKLGLQDVTMAYYAGTKTVVEAARSPIPEARQIYDDLYRWMHGNYGKP